MIGNEMTAVYDISPDISDEDISKINNKFEVMRETTDTYENESLFLSRAMTDAVKEKLDEINSSTTVKVNGEESGVVYSLDGKSVLGISGEAPVGSYISFMIKNSSGYLYADTVYADSYGKFDVKIPLNGSDGEYSVTVGKSSGESVNFSLEKKAADMSMEYIQVKYILDYASGMMLASEAAPIVEYVWQCKENGQIKTEFDIKCGLLPQKVMVFTAKYNNDVLEECDHIFLNLSPAQSETVTLSNTYSNDTQIKYKAFVWDENLRPCK